MGSEFRSLTDAATISTPAERPTLSLSDKGSHVSAAVAASP
jgi:hypothetical protein